MPAEKVITVAAGITCARHFVIPPLPDWPRRGDTAGPVIGKRRGIIATRTVGHALALGVVLLVAAMVQGADASADEVKVDRMTRSALQLDAHPGQGGATFQQICSRCHGAQAQGDAGRAIPALAGQRFAYLVRQLANFSGGERESATMHRVIAQPQLQEPQAWVDIAAYLNTLPVARAEATGDGKHIGLGRGIFHEQCASCHRPDARGDDAGFVPSLRNQHYSYLASQLHKLADGARHSADEDLVRFIRSLDDNDMTAVADYLSRLRGSGVSRKRMRDDGVVVD